ncbi:efflux RND transporter periplasmic adaptor subunit [Paracoccus seriniphilus]|uniref:RND family efflux transporter, MFP subunit n=1 Tax=Paracoccus seriniphilus TaxID=184748 RepID=A0A239PTS2_9RHOB|nr:efflux RND transporter periplasmic adaptor subunit [Paracoccus seriniphilus]WCR14209.1 efflux RND transporter periplasmic adaptor subunit [Paracoccus seriniphilus]SNT73097.1 RND family efflux transporter, MFP subunit [Paracoccus seriniphilus]
MKLRELLCIVVAGLGLAAPASALSLPSWLTGHEEAVAEMKPRPVVTEILQDTDEDTRWVPGIIASKTQVDMAFQTLGRMVERKVDLGARVTKGQVLAELAIEDLQANTRAAQAALDSAKVQLSTARSTLERTEALVARNVASDAQLEQAQRAAASAAAAVAQAESELIQAKDAEGFATMTAPFSGVVSAVYEAAGAVVGAGAPVLQLSAEDQREVVIDLPETALAGLPDDVAFTVWQRNDPDHRVPAVLDRIDPMADTATRTRRLYLSLPADTTFRLGALVRARLGTETAPVLTVASEAVVHHDDRSFVWCVLREGDSAYVTAVDVTPGPEIQGRVVVTSGLKAGDEVVIRGVNSLHEGQPVGRRVKP